MSRSVLVASLLALAALSLVGTSFAAADQLVGYPAVGGQAIRYAIGGALLLALARGRLPRPTARELGWLSVLAASGLAGFNLLVLAAVEQADPGSVGVVVGCVPLVLAVASPLAERRRPNPRLVLAALIVAAGAAAVQGLGGSMGLSALLLSLGALACEAAFSLFAAPVLSRLGALAVSAWACLLAVPILAVYALVTAGPDGVVALPSTREAVALLYLAVIVTTLAFVCWYTAVAAPRCRTRRPLLRCPARQRPTCHRRARLLDADPGAARRRRPRRRRYHRRTRPRRPASYASRGRACQLATARRVCRLRKTR